MASQVLNPRTPSHALEFGGHLITPVLVFLTPLTVYGLKFGCAEDTGCPPSLGHVVGSFLRGDWVSKLWDIKAFVAYLAWYAFCVAAWRFLPGEWVEGTKLRDGNRKKYKINAFSTLLLALGLVTGHIITNGAESFTFLYDHYTGLISASLLMAIVQGIYVFARSYDGAEGKLLSLVGNTGSFFYDFWMGRELNPSIGDFDIKSFNELRPGLILWVLVDISMACEQFCRLGGRVTASMVLVLAFHAHYVIDGLYNEPALFTTMDIVTDGFGFMLSIGDLCWVPFTYTLQARYLAFHPTELSPVAIAGVLAVQAAGYYIFRASNSEKNDFRNGKNPKGLTSMQTKRGTKLLTSGWWGWSRHPNYFGDLIMACAWCLPTGFDTPLPYFYIIYFMILLIHRQSRDDEACKVKYGEDWEKYCKIVPYKIIPYVY